MEVVHCANYIIGRQSGS